MTIYISGPMTGIKDNNFPAFHVAEKQLADAGHTVINPARFPVQPTYDDYLTLDLEVIAMAADAMYMLTGWERSPGALQEIKAARMLGKKIYFERILA